MIETYKATAKYSDIPSQEGPFWNLDNWYVAERPRKLKNKEFDTVVHLNWATQKTIHLRSVDLIFKKDQISLPDPTLENILFYLQQATGITSVEIDPAICRAEAKKDVNYLFLKTLYSELEALKNAEADDSRGAGSPRSRLSLLLHKRLEKVQQELQQFEKKVEAL